MSKFVGAIVGGLEIAAGVIIGGMTFGAAAPLSAMLIAAGVGTLISGVGTLLRSGSGKTAIAGGGGFSTAYRNPISPWVVHYGRGVLGGAIVHISEFGSDNKWMDMVIVLASHPCEAVEALMFDKKRVLLDAGGTSYTPVQEYTPIETITRVKGVVTVHMAASSTALQPGDQMQVKDVAGDLSLNGVWPVLSVFDNRTQFTFVCGGPDITLANDGWTVTRWPDYGTKVHMEVLLGNHTETFPGMLAGTPIDGGAETIVHGFNPWTSDHKLLGKTCVFLRLHYDQNIFSGGIPQISFLVKGKNDIYDPRLGNYGDPGTTGYTENASLCQADYLHNSTWGFGAAYGSEIPLPELIAGANICDENVGLANGDHEARYSLNGKFDLSAARGEVLQNMLTASAARLTYQGGQFKIWPAAWRGSSPGVGPTMDDLVGPFTWRPKAALRDLCNGVKGVYVSPANNWQASDIPAYAQDEIHNYEFDTWLEEDGGDRRWLDIQLPFTISSPTAQRICKIELMRRRHQGTGTFRLNLSGYSIAPMDVIQMTIPVLNWADKQLEVLAHRFTLDEQQDGDLRTTLLGVEIDVQETDADVYDWQTSEELTPLGYQQPWVPDPTTPQAPSGLQLVSNADTAVVGPNGKVSAVIRASWFAPDDGYVVQGGHIEIQYRQIVDYREGRVTAVNGWTDIIGEGTHFVKTMSTGVINIAGVQGAVNRCVDATRLILDENFTGPTVAGSLYSISYSDRWIGQPSVNPSVTEVSLVVTDGVRYDIAIRSVNAGGVPSSWVTASITASGAQRPLSWRPWGEDVFSAPFGKSINLAQRDNFIDISGYPPINRLSSTLAAPIIDDYGLITPHTYTDSFAGDRFPLGDWIAQVFGIDADGLYSRGSNFMQFSVNNTSSQLTFTAVFPNGTRLAQLFVGRDKDHLLHQGVIGNPVSGSLTYSAISTRAGWGPPDTRATRFHIEASREYHGGLFVATIRDASEGSITLGMPEGGLFAADQLAGRIISLISKAGFPDTQSASDRTITGNTPEGVLYLANYFLELAPGDLVMVRTRATGVGPNSIQDSGWVQPFGPIGLDIDQDKGKTLMILYDPTGSARAGDTVKVLGNSHTMHTVTTFKRVPGLGSIYIIVEPSNVVDVVTKEFENVFVPGSYEIPVIASIPADALAGHVALVRVKTRDADGNDSLEDLDALREIYVIPDAEPIYVTVNDVPVEY